MKLFLCMRVPTATLLVFLFIFSPFAPVFAQELSQTATTSEQPSFETSVEEAGGELTFPDMGEGGEMSLMSEEGALPPTVLNPTFSYQNLYPRVDKSSGAYIQTIPIVVPPGRNGVQPNLAISYNSQRLEDGFFGYGWNINIPYIERINRRGTNNMYTDDYFYSSLSGELASTTVSGQYRAKVEDGSLLSYTVTTASASTTWTMYDKNGTRYTFGITAEARMDNASSTDEVFKWMLEEVRDTNNNFVRYEYYKNQGQIYPYKIYYTGSGATDGLFQIEFLRETRPDTLTSYETRFYTRTEYRISEIQAKVNGTWSRKYELDYTAGNNGVRSMLSTVTESGRDEITGNTVTLPATTFQYSNLSTHTLTGGPEEVKSPAYVVTDIDGNGTRDVARSRRNGSGEVNQAFSLGPLEVGRPSGAQGVFFEEIWGDHNLTFTRPDEQGNRFLDFNGDGKADLLRSIWFSHLSLASTSILWNTTDYWDHSEGSFSWEAATATLSMPYFTSNSITTATTQGIFGNLNGDGVPDIQAEAGTLAYFGNGVTGFDVSTSTQFQGKGTLPSYGTPDTQDNRLADINGDGLDDWVRNDGSTLKVYLNNGTGWNSTHDTNWSYATTSVDQYGQDKGIRFIDVNGDGLLDFVRSYKLDPYTSIAGGGLPSEVADLKFLLLNTGFGWATTTIQLSETRIVTGSHTSGMWTGSWSWFERWGSGETTQDMLATTTYPTGGHSAVTYSLTTKQLKQWGQLQIPKHHSLPIPVFTVSKLINNDGLGNEETIDYLYGNGHLYWNGPYDRKFAGFETITELHPDTKTVTYYYQGNISSTTVGEFDDHFSKIGKPYREDVMDRETNALYKRNFYTYDRVDQGKTRNFVFLSTTTEQVWDGDGDAKTKASTFAYATATGNLVQKIDWGEVTGNSNGSFTDTGSDKFTTSYTHATGTNLSLLSTETKRDQSSVLVSESRNYYDSLSLGSVTAGNLTKLEQKIDGSIYASTTRAYNAYGLVTSEKNPRSNTTSYTYDTPNYLYPATTTNALSQTTGRTFDYSSGKVTSVYTPNSKSFVTTYDALDRVKEEKIPDPSTGTVTTKTAYVYTDTSLANSVKKSDYLNASNIVDSYTYLDGFGRTIQTKQEAEGSNFITKDIVYNTRGQVWKESLPYFNTSASRTSATTSLNMLSVQTYDHLGRVIAQSTAVGTTTTAYDQWSRTVTDPISNSKIYYNDAYGNLSRVDEINDAATHTTTYTYNGLGNLTKITDALSNVRNFTYDYLGRQTKAEDLHATADTSFGSTTYAYDLAGNVSSKRTPKYDLVNYTYDGLNRMLTEDYTGQAGTELSFTYDSCTNGIGHVCVASSTASRATYVYTPNELTSSETKTIGGTSYATSFTYDRQGNQTLIIHPDSTRVGYTFNNGGLTETVSLWDGTATTSLVLDFDYSPTNQVSYKQMGNGTESTYTFDPNELYRLKNLKTEFVGGVGGTMEDVYFDEGDRENPYTFADFSGFKLLAQALVPDTDIEIEEEETPVVLEVTEEDSQVSEGKTFVEESPTEEVIENDDVVETEALEESVPVIEENIIETETMADVVEKVVEEIVEEDSEDISTSVSENIQEVEDAVEEEVKDQVVLVKEEFKVLTDVELEALGATTSAQIYEAQVKARGGFVTDGLIKDINDARTWRKYHEERVAYLNTQRGIPAATRIGAKYAKDRFETYLDQKNYKKQLDEEKSIGGQSIFSRSLNFFKGLFSWFLPETVYAYLFGSEDFESCGSLPCSFDMDDSWGSVTPSLDSTSKVAGVDSLKEVVTGEGGGSQKKDGFNRSEIWVRFKIWVPNPVTWGASDFFSILMLQDGSDADTIWMNVEDYGNPRLILAGDVLSYTDTGLDLVEGQVNTVEMRVKIGASTGDIDIWLNNSTEGSPSYNGSGSMNTGTDNIDAVLAGLNYAPESGISTTYYDDVIISDDFIGSGGGGGNNAPTAPSALLTEGSTNPTDITDSTPEFSAIYNDPDGGDLATKYRLQVDNDSNFGSTHWDSGTTSMATTTAGQRSPDITYAGSTLASSTTYYWRILFIDDENAVGAWSTTTSTFTLAASGGGGTATSTIIQNITYTYDAVGNIIRMDDNSGNGLGKTVIYNYDDLYRLMGAFTSVASSSPYQANYTYNAIGNITSAEIGDEATSSPNTHSIDLERSSNQYLNAGNISIGSSSAITVEWWMNPESWNSSDATLVFGDNNGTGQMTVRGIWEANNLYVQIYDSVQIKSCYIPYTNTGSWEHFAFVADTSQSVGSRCVVYVNGSVVSDTEDFAGNSLFNSSANFIIGNDAALMSGRMFDGKIDDFRIWSDARTASEISNYYATELNGNEQGLRHNWKFNNSYEDSVSTGPTLTPSNSPVFGIDVPYLGSSLEGLLKSYSYAGTNYSNPHAVTQIADGVSTSTYTYDTNGNLVSEGATAYTWDYRNQLSQSVGSATSTYAYDESGQRVKLTEGSTTTNYPNRLYNTTGTSGTTTRSIFANGTLVATLVSGGTVGGGGTSTTTIHTIYGDSLRAGFESWSWDSTVTLNHTGTVYAGTNSTRVVYNQAWGGLYFRSATGVSTATSTHLQFAVRSASAGAYLELESYGPSDTLLGNVSLDSYIPGGSMSANTWYLVNIPLSDLDLDNTTMTGFVAMKDSTGTVYFDDVKLIYVSGGGGGGSATSTLSYIHPDHLESTNAVTDENGEVTQTLDYYPYGAERISQTTGTQSQRRFIGEVTDTATQLSYLNARYANTQRGQFLSQDPVFWEVNQTSDGKKILASPQLQNSYSYAGGNPIINKDPQGTFPWLAVGAVAAYMYFTSPTFLDQGSIAPDSSVAAHNQWRQAGFFGASLVGPGRITSGAGKALSKGHVVFDGLWSSGKISTPAASAINHAQRHAADFGLSGTDEYIKAARGFVTDAIGGKYPIKIGNDGMSRAYDTITNTFSAFRYNPNTGGTVISTFFKPSTGASYFSGQSGQLVQDLQSLVKGLQGLVDKLKKGQ